MLDRANHQRPPAALAMMSQAVPHDRRWQQLRVDTTASHVTGDLTGGAPGKAFRDEIPGLSDALP
jgi:hypothetical protein